MLAPGIREVSQNAEEEWSTWSISVRPGKGCARGMLGELDSDGPEQFMWYVAT